MARTQNSPQVEDGYIRIANSLLEAIMSFGFTQRELLVLMAIMRKTYGFNKKADDMSASQISALCKVSRQHVASTLVNLASRNVILKSPGQFGSIIGIQKDHRKWVGVELLKAAPASPESGQVASPDSGQGCPDLGLDGSPDSGQVAHGAEKSDFSSSESSTIKLEAAPDMDSTSPDMGQGCPDSGHVPIWVSTCPESGQVLVPIRDTQKTTPKDTKQKTDMSGKPDAIEVLQYLNLKANRNYKPVKANIDLIRGRLAESSIDECKAVIDSKVRQWLNDGKMREFLRPKTIFNATNFANYVGELGPTSVPSTSAEQGNVEAWRKDPRFARGQ